MPAIELDGDLDVGEGEVEPVATDAVLLLHVGGAEAGAMEPACGSVFEIGAQSPAVLLDELPVESA